MPVGVDRGLKNFILANARRFYSLWGGTAWVKNLNTLFVPPPDLIKNKMVTRVRMGIQMRMT